MVITGAPNLPVWNYDRGINHQPYSILTFDEVNSTVISMTQARMKGAEFWLKLEVSPPLKVKPIIFIFLC